MEKNFNESNGNLRKKKECQINYFSSTCSDDIFSSQNECQVYKKNKISIKLLYED